MLCTNGDGRIADYRVIAYLSKERPSTVAWCETCYDLLSPDKTIVCAKRIERPADPLPTEEKK